MANSVTRPRKLSQLNVNGWKNENLYAIETTTRPADSSAVTAYHEVKSSNASQGLGEEGMFGKNLHLDEKFVTLEAEGTRGRGGTLPTIQAAVTFLDQSDSRIQGKRQLNH